MLSKLVQDVFAKAKNESKEENKTSLCGYLETALSEEVGANISSRNLLRLYDSYILLKDSHQQSINESNRNLLAKYIGYESYTRYTKAHSKNHSKSIVQFGKNITNIETLNGNIENN